MSAKTELMSAALDYGSRGLLVMPNHHTNEQGCCSCGTVGCQTPPAKSRGKHPRVTKWGKKASADETIIAGWWKKWPLANIGVLLGPRSNIIDVEFDTEEGRAAADKYLGGIVTPSYSSGRSIHRIFLYSTELDGKGGWKKGELVEQLEIRIGADGKAAQSIFPPSRHYSGKVYGWLPGLSLDEVEIAEIPPELMEVLRKEDAEQARRGKQPHSTRRPVTATSSGEGRLSGKAMQCLAFLKKCPDAISGKNGHGKAFRAACECYRRDLTDDEALVIMRWFSEHKSGGEPWTEEEIRHKLEDAKMTVSAESRASKKATRSPKGPQNGLQSGPQNGLQVGREEGPGTPRITPDDKAPNHSANLSPGRMNGGMINGKDNGTDSRVPIFAGPKEHEVADQAVAALVKRGGIYQRGGNLVEVVRDPEPPKGIIRPPGSVYITTIPDAGIWDNLSKAARFFRYKGKDQDVSEDVPTPARIAKIIGARRTFRSVPVIEGITHAPSFLADGSILATAGYHKQSGLYLDAGSIEFPAVPQSPKLADAKKAAEQLLEVVCDFPFANDAHQASWLATALTPAARHAIDGHCPLFVVDANVRGSGKSKLLDLIGVIHLGTELPRTSAPEDNAASIKQITSILLAAEPIVMFDNVIGPLGAAALDSVLTGPFWNERILGASKMTGRLVANTIWTASGNNIVYRGDTPRRALHMRLESPVENPEERQGFKHPDLVAFVKRHRARLAVAAVTILRAYHVAGRPKMGLPEWGSFEAWSDLIRNAVVWLGYADPGRTRQAVRDESDNDAAFLRQLLAAWEGADPRGLGLTVQQAIQKAADGNVALQAVFSEIGAPGKPPNTRSIGMKLHHLRGRVACGKRLERRSGDGHVTLWKVSAARELGD